jgi:outer membrane receptor protein involved in Fe transport
LILHARASRNLSYKVQSSNTGPAVEQVRNLAGAFARQIEWNGNAQVRWQGQQFGFGWSTRYLDYVLAQPGFYLLQGADRVPRALEHDLNVNYRAPTVEGARGMRELFSGISLNFGVRNVFDRTPRFWAASSDRGIAPYDSIAGRSLWMQMSKAFGE